MVWPLLFVALAADAAIDAMQGGYRAKNDGLVPLLAWKFAGRAQWARAPPFERTRRSTKWQGPSWRSMPSEAA